MQMTISHPRCSTCKNLQKTHAADPHAQTQVFMKILFICTHNRCRSILAEAITNLMSDGRIVAKSAGSQPAGMIHPLTLRYLHDAGVSTDGLYSKSWDELESFEPDVVITVCDDAAQE